MQNRTSNGSSGKPDAFSSRAGASPASPWKTATRYACRALVVTTGTFLNGLIHIGPEQQPAGRVGEPPSSELAESLKSIGFEWGRLKTGTPPRLDRESIDFDAPGGARRFPRRTRRRSAGPVLLSVAAFDAAADRLSSPAHQRSRPRSRARQHRSIAVVQRTDSGYRPALLPVARGQDRAVPRQGASPDFP